MTNVQVNIFFRESEIDFGVNEYEDFATLQLSNEVAVYSTKEMLRKFAEELLKELNK